MGKADRERPIGVFDSGIGGLTVLKALSRRMPREGLVYFGDTAHIPYGSKSRQAVTRYSLEAARFLASRDIKALVVACNTSSALALGEVQGALSVPVLGVIQPGAKAAAEATRNGRVGDIGTEATVASGAYAQALKNCAPSLKVFSTACPLFVPLVEEGWWGHPVTAQVAKHYLARLKHSRIDVLVLGCTHYPLLKGVLRREMGGSVKLIDSAEQTALETEQLLSSLKLLRQAGSGRREFFVSDGPGRFLKLSKRLLGVAAERVSLQSFD